MDRRKALGLAAALPVFALGETGASACSLAIENPESYAARLPGVASLFRAWFARDELKFVGTLVGPRSDNASDDFVRRAIDLAEDREPHRLFAELFTDETSYKKILAMTGVGENVFVAVSEQGAGGIGPDCSNLPRLHLFLVGYRSGSPARIVHIQSETWTGYGQVTGWSSPN